MNPLSIPDHILFALLAFVMPIAMIWRKQPLQFDFALNTRWKIRIYWINSLVLWAGVLFVIGVWWLNNRPLELLGFQMPTADSFPHWMILSATFVLFYFADVLFAWTSEDEHPAAAILPANAKEFAHFGSVVSLSAAICEEIIFRGFLVTYLLTLLEGNPYAGVITIAGSAVVFGIGHSYQGFTSLFKIILFSILFAWLFVMTHSLILVIILHFLVDFCSGLLALLRLKEDKMLAKQYR
jgi:membrane protease YdiL (CAAX protease family)